MIIGMDYDDTFSADPDLFLSLCRQMLDAGHRVVGVTLRNRGQQVTDHRYHEACEAIIYCAGLSKRKLTTELGYHIDVWIDDAPEYIANDWSTVNGKAFEVDLVEVIPDLLEPLVVITQKNDLGHL